MPAFYLTDSCHFYDWIQWQYTTWMKQMKHCRHFSFKVWSIKGLQSCFKTLYAKTFQKCIFVICFYSTVWENEYIIVCSISIFIAFIVTHSERGSIWHSSVIHDNYGGCNKGFRIQFSLVLGHNQTTQ